MLNEHQLIHSRKYSILKSIAVLVTKHFIDKISLFLNVKPFKMNFLLTYIQGQMDKSVLSKTNIFHNLVPAYNFPMNIQNCIIQVNVLFRYRKINNKDENTYHGLVAPSLVSR